MVEAFGINMKEWQNEINIKDLANKSSSQLG